ncbi:NAD(P)-binding protein [Daldinia loculata]|uniref:NAD(P)-binding protein n=1 Tax=Daldinia loculata TaxID=103429 RepID=UPI0020C58BDC|nr:NAD(P)-binding protein [Daldinia loculata]KAI1649762.1 NAD(P)-binding protein [Daldinia loculata]KAI2784735.1 NAD(P)-binding protein [Daldinia loculata]
MPVPTSQYISNVWKEGIFDGRVVFVTGGAGTICSAQTRALVHLGANACIIGRNQQKTEAVANDIATARKGAKVIGIGGCDVRNPDDLVKAAERCVKELGAIDFVIAGAAGNFVSPISGLSSNGFKTVIEIDVLGTYNTVKATIPYLIESAARNKSNENGLTGGRIIYISATFHYTGMPMQAHVMAAKASVDSIMASVALEYGPYGVTSNVIAPGGIEGTEGMARLAGKSDEAKNSAAGIPLGRWGTIRDIADATVYLFSDAGSYVTGEVLVVDGGDWRNGGMGVGLDSNMKYPDYLLTGEFSKHVKSGRKDKSKL